ncbi:bifunctional ornithine acetyltransferase/N-acetylglutamate synthase, partial [Streptomyces decoyicus]
DRAAAELTEHGGEKAAIAIKTTDSVHKTAVVTRTAGSEAGPRGRLGCAGRGARANEVAVSLSPRCTDTGLPYTPIATA